MTVDFAFLVLQEHPYGREMLRILLEQDLTPRLIVQEVSPVAEEERAKFLTRITGQSLPPSMSDLTAGLDIPCLKVGDHNDAHCYKILDEQRPALVVLGGTRIIRPPLLELPSLGMINAHPGLLPLLRGSSSVAWALYKDLPVGSTTHYIDARIDTGPILLRRQLPVCRGETYERIVRRVLTLSGQLMAESLALFQGGEAPAGTDQDPAVGETLRVIPPDLLAEAKGRLARGEYSHFTDCGENSHG
jgi:methionyl-tRNA formyltransferase